MRTVVVFSALMRLAHELGQAELSGDVERIAAAQQAHDEYRDLVLAADSMILDVIPRRAL